MCKWNFGIKVWDCNMQYSLWLHHTPQIIVLQRSENSWRHQVINLIGAKVSAHCQFIQRCRAEKSKPEQMFWAVWCVSKRKDAVDPEPPRWAHHRHAGCGTKYRLCTQAAQSSLSCISKVNKHHLTDELLRSVLRSSRAVSVTSLDQCASK